MARSRKCPPVLFKDSVESDQEETKLRLAVPTPSDANENMTTSPVSNQVQDHQSSPWQAVTVAQPSIPGSPVVDPKSALRPSMYYSSKSVEQRRFDIALETHEWRHPYTEEST